MAETAIEWTDKVWNPTTGCDRVSPGCDNCYALTMAKRLQAMGQAKYQTDGDPRTSGPGFGLAMHDDVVNLPLTWRRPRRVFVNSMSDLFHPRVSTEFLARVFAVMIAAPMHTYQVLTKRAPRMCHLMADPGFWEAVSVELGKLWASPAPQPLTRVPEWIWLGVSVENQEQAEARIPRLLETPAAVRWLSCEPLLSLVDIERYLYLTGASTAGRWTDWSGAPRLLDGVGQRLPSGVGGMTFTSLPSRDLHWVVVGGESGPRARPMPPDWARLLRDQCTAAGVPFFFKQWGDWCDQDQLPADVWRDIDAAINLGGEQHPQPLRVGKKRAGRILDERLWDEFPTVAQMTATGGR